jgi:hypothetical protein
MDDAPQAHSPENLLQSQAVPLRTLTTFNEIEKKNP